MKRPPSRTGSPKKKRPSNVVPLFPKAPPKAPKVKAPSRQFIRRESKRLSIQEKNSRAAISRLKPKVEFGRRVLIASIAAVSVLAILVTVAVLSPLLAVRKIEIVGANRVSAEAIEKDLKSLKGKPLPQVTSEELAAKLSKYQLIDSVSAVALPPSTLRVVVVERTAIVVVRINEILYLYDAAGVQLGRAKGSDKLPLIENAGDPGTSKTFKQAINVILSIPLELLPKVASISATSKDDVVLQLRTYNQRIMWGDDSDPALKAKVLSALMKHYDKRYGQTFDVSSPNQPSVF
ncbi:MAG: hypothetical protein RL166_401 [Actinomycetota bacterium]